jgi:hypothetical protein
MRTLYPVGPNGVPDTSHPGTVASFGVAIYVAGCGHLPIQRHSWLGIA